MMPLNNFRVYLVYCLNLAMFGFYISALGPIIPYLAES